MAEAVKKLQAYKDELATKAELLITSGLPMTIIKIDEMMKTKMFREVYEELNRNDSKDDEPTTLPHTLVYDLLEVVKPISRQVIDDLTILEMWIEYNIPKIECGDNLGVSIQEEFLELIRNAKSFGVKSYRNSTYFQARAKLTSKVIKYPYIEDYRRAVKELDERKFLHLWILMRIFRDTYLLLHDSIIKNWEKLKMPRSSNCESLY